jgi:hypothetical protein
VSSLLSAHRGEGWPSTEMLVPEGEQVSSVPRATERGLITATAVRATALLLLASAATRVR